MTPSVSFKVNIPEDMSSNFYSGICGAERQCL